MNSLIKHASRSYIKKICWQTWSLPVLIGGTIATACSKMIVITDTAKDAEAPMFIAVCTIIVFTFLLLMGIIVLSHVYETLVYLKIGKAPNRVYEECQYLLNIPATQDAFQHSSIKIKWCFTDKEGNHHEMLDPIIICKPGTKKNVNWNLYVYDNHHSVAIAKNMTECIALMP